VRLRVWDLPVRLVHWLVVLLVAFSWVTAEKSWLAWHKFSGYAILSLIVFRIYWGISGSSTARFKHFLCGPRAVWSYVRALHLRDRQQVFLGHNPIGGWAVVALLFVLLLQTGLGFFAVDVDGLESGPLARYVSFASGRQIAALHANVFNVLLLLIGLHITAVLAHLLYKRENLIAPMLTGIKRVTRAQAQALSFAPLWRAVVGFVSVLLILVSFFGL
jgi:cytochrome b